MKFDNYMDPRKTFGKAVTQEAEKNEDIVVLSADSGKSSGFGEFIEKYPDRYFECGIMEQGVIGISSGLATTGKVPDFLCNRTVCNGQDHLKCFEMILDT